MNKKALILILLLFSGCLESTGQTMRIETGDKVSLNLKGYISGWELTPGYPFPEVFTVSFFYGTKKIDVRFYRNELEDLIKRGEI